MRHSQLRKLHLNWSFTHFPLLLLSLIAFSISTIQCTTDTVEVVIMERTDLIIEGDLNMQAFIQNPQDEGFDLIELSAYGVPASRLDILMDLGSGYTLILRVYNDMAQSIEKLVNHSYSIYPPEDIEDKLQYLTAELHYGSEAYSYVSNLGANLPPGINVDALKVSMSDDILINGQLRDVVLYKNTDPDKSITVSGTFIVVLDIDSNHAKVK